MIKRSADNHSKSSAECLVISLWQNISPQFNRSKNYEQINNVSSVTQNPASQFTQLSCVLFPRLHVWSNLGWMLQTFHVRFPVLVNHAKWNTFVIDVESQKRGILTAIVHGSSGETYPISWSNTFLVWESYVKTVHGCHSTSSL